MTVWTASAMVAGVQPRYLPSSGGVNVLSTVALTVALALNDTINLVQLIADASDPNGVGPTIIGMELDIDQLDSNGSPTIKFNVGDVTATNPPNLVGVAARYYSQTTIAQAGGYAVPNVNGVLGFQPFAGAFSTYPTQSKQTYNIIATVQTGAATPKAGTFRIVVGYTFDP